MTTAATLGWIDEQEYVPGSEQGGFGAVETARGVLPLKRLEVETQIVGLVARTRLRQVFFNAYDEPLEATYVFPLQPAAAVCEFTLSVAGRRVSGELKERGEARAQYDRAIAAGHRAAIAEEDRADVFSMRVGNLPRGEEAVVELVVVTPLSFSAGEATFRFPLVVAPRYVPGVPIGTQSGAGTSPDTDAAPDASRISPPTLLKGYPNKVELALSVKLDACGLEIEDLRSTLHAARVERSKERAYLEIAPGERIDRDFILRFRVSQEAITTSCVATPARQGKEGVVQVTLVPPMGRVRERQARDVVFVLDRSGSMEGWKMVAARRALGRMIDALSGEDRFSVLAFDNVTEAVHGSRQSQMALIQASDRERYRTIEALSKVEARGGTEMAGPLKLACDVLREGGEGRVRWIVLVTDGQVGNEDQILRHVSGQLQGAKVFCVGIDRAVNEGFLKRLADLGSGGFELVESEERLDEVMDQVHRAIDTPVLSEVTVRLEGKGAVLEGQVPSRVAGVFPGQPLRISGRYRGELGEGACVVVEGCDALGDTWRERVPLHVRASEAVEAFWARGRVRELEDRLAVGRGDRGALRQEIINVSLGYGVLSRFTAYVAVDEAEVIARRDKELKKVMQPVETPQGWGEPAPEEPMSSRTMSAPMSAPVPDATSSAFGPMSPPAPMSPPTPMQSAPAPMMRGGSGGGETKRRQAFNEARASRAESQAQMREQLSSVSDSRSFSAFESEGSAPEEGAFEDRADDAFSHDAFDAADEEAAEMTSSVLDFGAGRDAVGNGWAGQEASGSPLGGVTMTQAGVLKATTALRTMSPERVGALPLSAASEVYELGALLYWLLTRRPYHGEDSSEFAVMAAIMQGAERARLWRAEDEVSEAMRALIAAMLEREPGQRPTMREVVTRLREGVSEEELAEGRKALLGRAGAQMVREGGGRWALEALPREVWREVEVRQLGVALAGALAEAHEQGALLHQGVSLKSVWLDERGEVGVTGRESASSPPRVSEDEAERGGVLSRVKRWLKGESEPKRGMWE